MSSSDEYDKMVEQVREFAGLNANDIVLPSPLGPIKVGDLTFLEGWRWNLHMIGYPGTEPVLTRGGPAVTLANYTDEKGWVISFLAQFRSPYGMLNFTADDWTFSPTPFVFNLSGMTVPTNITVWCNVYNPATALGPLYGLVFEPAYACPYTRRVQITLSLPAVAPIAQTTVFIATIGRIYIVDERTFLRSVKKFMLEQMTGVKMERYP